MMAEGFNSRYRELEKVCEALYKLDVSRRALPEAVDRLRKRAERALNFKQTPRNLNMDSARDAARIATKRKADEFKATVQPAIEAARKEGHVKIRDIAAYLNKAGIKTSRGGEWSPGTLHRFLKELD